MEQVYNADLANSWGNLVSRSLNMSAKYFDGKTPALTDGWADAANPLRDLAQGIAERYSSHMDLLQYGQAKDVVMELVHAANHYIEDSTPWAVAKDPARADELSAIITNLLESIRICAHLLAPFMPSTSAEVLRRMSLEDEAGTTDLAAACVWGGLKGDVPVTKGDALFPRLQSK
jgi:methionyl-tRNA synthetase